jgi:protease-4
VWSGAQAKNLGLVDQLGGTKEAIALAHSLAQLDDDNSRVVYVEEELSPFAHFMSNMTQKCIGSVV